MKSQQPTAPSLSDVASVPRNSTPAWRPVHPFLRGVSAVLSVVLVFVGVPTGVFAEEITLKSGAFSVDLLPVAKTSLGSAASTINSGSFDYDVNPSFSISSGSVNLSLTGLTFQEKTPGAFSRATAQFVPTSVNTLTLSGRSTSAVGLTLPNQGMTLLMGTHDGTTGRMTKLLLAKDQKWLITGGADNATTLAGAIIDSTNYAPARVERASDAATPLTLTLEISHAGSGSLGSAWLDVGDSVNLVKVSSGDLYLTLGEPNRTAFNGQITIRSGAVVLGGSFLSAPTNGVAPTITFEGGDAALKVTGFNTVSEIFGTEDYPQSSISAGTVFDLLSLETISAGTLAIQSVGEQKLANQFLNGSGGEVLSLRKQGLGTVELLNPGNSFSGGVFVEAGTLAVLESGLEDLSASVIGIGTLTLYGGSSGATLRVGSASQPNVKLYNDLLLAGGSVLSSKSRAVIEGATLGYTLAIDGPVIIAAEGSEVGVELIPTNFELDLRTRLDLNVSLTVSGTLTLTGGGTLMLSSEMRGFPELGDFVLSSGTLILGVPEAVYSGITLSGPGGAQRWLIANADVRISAGPDTVLPIWESDFSFSGGANKLEIEPYSFDSVAVAIKNSVRMTLVDGTLALGKVQWSPDGKTSSLIKTGSGTLEFKDDIALGSSKGLTRLEISEGAVVFSNPTATDFKGDAAFSRTTVEVQQGNVSISGDVSGTGFTKTGDGLLAFNGANSISGTTVVRSGALSLAAGTSAIQLGDAQTTSSGVTLITTGAVSGPVTIGSQAATAYKATLASSNTTGVAGLSGDITLAPGSASLVLQAEEGGTLDISSAWARDNKPITVGAPGKTGTVRVSRLLETPGGISITAGTLQVGKPSVLSASTPLSVTGGVLDLGGFNTSVESLTLTSGNISDRSGTGVLTATSENSLTVFSGTISANIGGTHAPLIRGNVTLAGANTFTAPIRVASGATLTVASSGALAKSTVDFANAFSGTLRFASGLTAATFGGLTGNRDITLKNDANSPIELTVANATDMTYEGNLIGPGCFAKAGAGTLTLSQPLPSEVTSLKVMEGRLKLDTGSASGPVTSSLSILNEGTIDLTLSAPLTYNGILRGSGTINLTASSPVTLTLGSGAKLGGNIVLTQNVTLDLRANSNFFADDATLDIRSGASVLLGTGTQTIANLLISDGGMLRGSSGAKVLYGSLNPSPEAWLDDNPDGQTQTPKLNNGYADTEIVFEVSSKSVDIPNGLKVTAGRAGNKADNRDYLVLQPESNTTKVIVDQALTINKGIEAILGTLTGTTRALVSIENTLTLKSGSIMFASGVEATLTQNGSLNAPLLQNNGSLTVDVSTSKTVGLPISGVGSLRKTGAGILTLTGANSYEGATTLSKGTLELGSDTAIGTNGNVFFEGGTLRYANGFNRDISGRIRPLASGTVAGIDTGENTVTYATGLTGAGGIAKLGLGTLVLSGANGFTGTADIMEGVLQVGTGDATGSMAASAYVSPGSTLRFQRADNLFYGGSLTGLGTLEQAGTGVLELNGKNDSFGGTLRLTSGVTTVSSESASGSSDAKIVFNGGALRYGAGFSKDLSLKIAELNNGASAKIDTGDNTVAFANGLKGTGGLVKLGAGTLDLRVGSSFSGETTVTEGLLRAGTALLATTGINVNGGTLEANSYSRDATLKVGSNGTARLTGQEMTVGTIENAGRVTFTGGTSYIQVASLRGNGSTSFENDADIHSGVTGGSVEVKGLLVTPTVSGGNLSAARILGSFDGGGTTRGVDVSGGSLSLTDPLGTVGSHLGIVTGGNLTFSAPVRVDVVRGGALALLSGVTVMGTVSGGEIVISRVGSSGLVSIETLNGGNIQNFDTLDVKSGDTSGSISGSGALSKMGPSSLTLRGMTTHEGVTQVYEGTLNLSGAANLQNSSELFVESGAQARFTETRGNITLKALTGYGEVSFAGNTAVSKVDDFRGSINLVSSTLSVSAGIYQGTLTGSGSLNKTGPSELSLTSAPSSGISVSVQEGTLKAFDLLKETRQVVVSPSAQLTNEITTGTYAGKLTGGGSTTLTANSEPQTLSLGTSARLEGSLTLGKGVTLDVSLADNEGVDPAPTLTLLTGSQLNLLRAEQRFELYKLTLNVGSKLSSTGATIVYDEEPVLLVDGKPVPILTQENQLLPGAEYQALVAGSLTFEENSVRGSVFSGGTYQFVAGRVKDLPQSEVVNGTLVQQPVNRLLLDPNPGKTVRILTVLPRVAQEVVATGSAAGSGFVSVGTLVSTPRFVIGSRIRATFLDNGSLSPDGVFTNNGTLQFAVTSGSKPVTNLISGSGTLEKLAGGTLVLSGTNTYTGPTRLSGGLLQVNNSAALGAGTSDSIVFNGGGLKYGPGVSTDFSSRIAAIEAGIVAAIDTDTNNVTYSSGLKSKGTGGIAKLGSGTLVLAGKNTFAGTAEVREGVLQVGTGGASGSIDAPAFVESGALLRFLRAGELAYAGSITGSGRVEQAGTGQLALQGDGKEFTGTFDLSSGTTLIGNPDALAGGTIAFKGGTLKYGTDGVADLSDRVTLNKTALVDTDTYNVEFGGGLKGEAGAGLTKYGLGTLTLSGANEYSGVTTVASGSLRYKGDALAAAGAIQTQAKSTVVLDDNGSSTSFGGVVTGAAQLLKTGAGLITIGKSQTNTGGVNLQNGTVEMKDSATFRGRVNVNADSTLRLLEGGLHPSTELDLTGGSLELGGVVMAVTSLDIAAGKVTYAGAEDESATVFFTRQEGDLPDVAGVSWVSATNAYGSPAPLKISLAGTVFSLPSTSSLTIEANNGKLLTFAVDGGLNLDSFTGENGVNLAITKPVNVKGDFRLQGGSLRLDSALTSTNVVLGASSTAVTGSINSGGSVVAQELTLTGPSTLTLNNVNGLRDVQTLQVGVSTTAGGSSAATLEIPTGTLTLAESQTLKGSGTVRGNVTLGENAVLSPGNSPGTLRFAGTLDLANGTVRIEVGTLASGALINDRIDVTAGTVAIGSPTFQIVDTDGVLATGGTLNSIFVGANPPLNGGTFTFARQSSTGALLPSVMYTSNNSLAALQVSRLRFAAFAGSARNVVRFANALDTRILTQRATSDGLLELGTGIQSTAGVPAQLAAAMPVAYAEMAGLSTQRTLNLHQGLVGRFSSIRANVLDTPEGAFVAWSTGYGAGHRQDGQRGIGTAGFSASTWGDLFGVEQRIGSLLVGVTGAAGRTTATFENNPGRATTDSWHGGLYGTLDLEGFVFESGALFGGTDTRARRTVSAPGLTTRQGRVNLDGTEWVANVGIAKPIAAAEALTLTPTLRFIAQGQSQSGASESDLSGLEVRLAKQTTVTYQHQAGVELRRALKLSGVNAFASLQLDWIHNYNAKGRNLKMALSGDPAASYGYKGSDAGADAFHIGSAVEAALTERITLRLGGEYQAQTSLSTLRGSVSVGYQF